MTGLNAVAFQLVAFERQLSSPPGANSARMPSRSGRCSLVQALELVETDRIPCASPKPDALDLREGRSSTVAES